MVINMKDFSGTDYKIGDYVFCAVHAGCSSVSTFVAKVVKINPRSVKVIKNIGRKEQRYGTSSMLMPERHLIIPEELALKLDIGLKDAKCD